MWETSFFLQTQTHYLGRYVSEGAEEGWNVIKIILLSKQKTPSNFLKGVQISF